MTTASSESYRSLSVWTSESGKAEEETDKDHLARSHQPEPVDVEDRDDWRRRTSVADFSYLRDSQPEGERDFEMPRLWDSEYVNSPTF